jgi:hypothetical protein
LSSCLPFMEIDLFFCFEGLVRDFIAGWEAADIRAMTESTDLVIVHAVLLSGDVVSFDIETDESTTAPTLEFVWAWFLASVLMQSRLTCPVERGVLTTHASRKNILKTNFWYPNTL